MGLKNCIVMSRILLIAGVVMCLLLDQAQGQQASFELGGFLGVSNYMGDLQQTRFETEECHPAYGAFARWYMNSALGLKLHFYKGKISGRDANYDGLLVRERNLQFESPVYELGMQMEVAFSHFGEGQLRVAAPYCFFGFGLFHFNPKTLYQGRWVSLQPLGTEGQSVAETDRTRYKLVQWSIPFGVGFNINIGKQSNFGFELGIRKTFTDYLDDVSGTYPDIDRLADQDPLAAALSFRTPEYLGNQLPNPEGQPRGNPETLDFYFFGGFTFSTILMRWYKQKMQKHPIKGL